MFKGSRKQWHATNTPTRPNSGHRAQHSADQLATAQRFCIHECKKRRFQMKYRVGELELSVMEHHHAPAAVADTDPSIRLLITTHARKETSRSEVYTSRSHMRVARLFCACARACVAQAAVMTYSSALAIGGQIGSRLKSKVAAQECALKLHVLDNSDKLGSRRTSWPVFTILQTCAA